MIPINMENTKETRIAGMLIATGTSATLDMR